MLLPSKLAFPWEKRGEVWILGKQPAACPQEARHDSALTAEEAVKSGGGHDIR